MTILKYSLVMLHIIAAAAWFGLGLRLAAQARSVAEAGTEAAQALADNVQRSVTLMNVFAVLLLVFALGALFAGGGFARYGWPYHSSITLVLLLILDQYFVIRPAWNTLRSAVGSNADAVDGAVTRIAAGTGTGHLLWLATLVLMYWEQMFGV